MPISGEQWPALAIPTAKPAVKRQRQSKPEHLGMAWPALPPSGHPFFWLAAYLQSAAKEAAVRHLLSQMYSPKRRAMPDLITQIALSSAQMSAWQEIKEAAQYVREDGLLLYAWQGTTCFNTNTARH